MKHLADDIYIVFVGENAETKVALKDIEEIDLDNYPWMEKVIQTVVDKLLKVQNDSTQS